MQTVRDEVKRDSASNNDVYKQHADARRRFIEFEKGDMVLVLIRLERLPPRVNKKLHPYNVVSSRSLRRLVTMLMSLNYL